MYAIEFYLTHIPFNCICNLVHIFYYEHDNGLDLIFFFFLFVCVRLSSLSISNVGTPNDIFIGLPLGRFILSFRLCSKQF